MKLRDRLADLISGGELSRLREAEGYWFEAALDLRPHNNGGLPASVIFCDAIRTVTPKNGNQPRPIGKFGSVSEAARKPGVTRQEAKRILGAKK